MPAPGKAEAFATSIPLELTAGRAVRVTVPAKIAFNLDQMQKVTQEVLGRLGCDKCHSGWDIRFKLEEDFFVDERGNVRGGIGGIGG